MTTASSRSRHSLAERQQVLDALAASPGRRPLDAYRLARDIPGMTPMLVGQILHELHQEGCVATQDPLGTANDLAASFTVADRAHA